MVFKDLLVGCWCELCDIVVAPKADKHKKKKEQGRNAFDFFLDVVISEVNLFILGKKVWGKKRAHRHAFRLHVGCLTNPVIWATVVSAFWYLR